MIERLYWVVSFQINVKRVSREILEGEPLKTIGWARPLFPLTPKWLALCQIPWGRCWFNHFKYFENHKNLCQWIFGMLIIQNIRFLFRDAKYFFPCFSRVLPAKRLFQKIDCIAKSNPLPNPNFRFHPSFPPLSLSLILSLVSSSFLQDDINVILLIFDALLICVPCCFVVLIIVKSANEINEHRRQTEKNKRNKKTSVW